MLYSFLADLVVVLHFAFIVFVVGGAVLVYFKRKLIWLHVPCALWGAWIEFSGWLCPLTPLENWLRQRANEVGYSESFVAHYLMPIIYPSGLTSNVQIALGLIVVFVNVVMYLWIVRRWRAERKTHP
ncbi:DUF2784 domain-containing protein [candidate division KSB1 bacterium]|nr:DUF2784 domain-containing protein [candidate division KSB1 bacterium]